MAAVLVPGADRARWRSHWLADLESWWILVERGELGIGRVEFCRAALMSAGRLRLETLRLSRWMRQSSFVVALAVAALALTAALSGGFEVTRSLAAEALSGPRPRYLYEHRVFGYTAPIVLAWITAVIVILIGPLPLRARGWRYWTFLAGKIAAVSLLLPLVWIEGGSALRQAIPHFGLKMLGAGLLLAFVFVALFGACIRWCFVDQRQRCPVCLRRLTLPVTLGSWGSVFEPAKTELLCEEGHGSLAMGEAASGEPDRWIALDASWKGL